MSSLDAELITDLDRLNAIAPAWDALAVASRRPLVSPAWMLAFWRHVQPPDAELRVVALHDDGELVGIAPFFAQRKRGGHVDVRMLGRAMPRTGPLALPGREWEAAAATAAVLARSVPRADAIALESGPLKSHWPAALAESWPGPARPLLRRYYVQPSHVVSLTADSADAWLATKGQHFRKAMKRLRRRVAEAGGTVRMSTAATLREDVATFIRLHAARWEGRGASEIVALASGLAAVYEEVGRAHAAAGRFRLYLLELDGEPVAAELLAAAGGEVASINGGWDPRHAKLGVSNACMLHAIEDAFARGDTRLDWGPGDQLFKRRFANGNDPVCWTLLVTPGFRTPLALARVAPVIARIQAREAVKRAIPAERLDHVRKLRERVRA